MNARFLRLLALGMTVLALTACGGGGGGDPAPATPPTASAATLTPTNYRAAARAALESGTSVIESLEWLVGIEQSRVPDMLSLVISHAGSALRRRAPGLEWPVGISESFTDPCSGGGSVRYDDEIASADRTSVGDSTRLTFSNCVESGVTLQGALTARITELSGDIDRTYQFRVVVAVSFADLRTSVASTSLTSNGSLTLIWNSRSANDHTLRAEVASLAVQGNQAGSPYQRTLSGYHVEWTTTSGLITVTSGGTITTSDLDGRAITVSTTAPVRMRTSAAYPHEGVMRIQGASGSEVRVTMLGAGAVRLELDANGDGSHETVVTTTWNELLGG